jgi:hypothetical protein
MNRQLQNPRQLFTGLITLLFSLTLSAQTSTTFTYSGAVQAFTVRLCVTSITVDMKGAAGANAVNKLTANAIGGLGGEAQAVMNVTPGQVLYLM